MQMFPLTVTNAISRRHGKTLVGPVSCTLMGTGTTIVLGPNGSGKTTLLRLFHGSARLHSGTVTWACDAQIARQQTGFVFQRPVMLRRSVLDNLIYPLRLRGITKKDARFRGETIARRVGLSDLLGHPAPVLSGGEQQKLALARALITDPKILFLDEPCAALDGKSTRDIETILQDAVASGTRLIMATHDLGQARRLADDVLFLLNGQVAEHTPAQRFFDCPTSAPAQAFLNGDIVE